MTRVARNVTETFVAVGRNWEMRGVVDISVEWVEPGMRERA